MPLCPVVVGLELDESRDGPPLVLGLVAVFSTHTSRFTSIGLLAEIFAKYPLRPARIPEEEGWSGIADLPTEMWYELQTEISRRTPAWSAEPAEATESGR